MRLLKRRKGARSAAQAHQEARLSRERLEETRRITEDIERIVYAENHFADAIARQILKGRRP